MVGHNGVNLILKRSYLTNIVKRAVLWLSQIFCAKTRIRVSNSSIVKPDIMKLIMRYITIDFFLMCRSAEF